MFKNILVPLDGSLSSECVLAHAITFARVFDARITLLTVVQQRIESFGRPGADPLDWYLHKTAARTYLDTVKAAVEKLHSSVDAIVVEGRAIERIVEMAHTHDIDLVVLSSYSTHNGEEWSVSGILPQVAQRIGTSLLTVRASQTHTKPLNYLQYRRVLAPLDGSRRAGTSLPFATALTQAHHAELMLVHVVTKPEMARHMPLTHEEADLINRVVERNQEEGARYLAQIRDHLPADAQLRLLVSDNIATTLQTVSAQEDVDLMILSAHGYSGEAKWPYGSVTNRFITDGAIPLLVIQDLPQKAMDVVRDGAGVRQLVR